MFSHQNFTDQVTVCIVEIVKSVLPSLTVKKKNKSLPGSKLSLYYIKLIKAYVGLDGGGGGNRTRVRRLSNRNLYKFSFGFVSRAFGSPKRDSPAPVPLSFPMRRWDGRCSGRPALLTPLISPPAGERRDALLYLSSVG
jgi:hypothetical protein